MILSRRSLISGAAAFIAAPAIVRASSLMIIKPERPWRRLPELIAINGIVRIPRNVRVQLDANGNFLGVILEGSRDGYSWMQLP